MFPCTASFVRPATGWQTIPLELCPPDEANLSGSGDDACIAAVAMAFPVTAGVYELTFRVGRRSSDLRGVENWQWCRSSDGGVGGCGESAKIEVLPLLSSVHPLLPPATPAAIGALASACTVSARMLSALRPIYRVLLDETVVSYGPTTMPPPVAAPSAAAAAADAPQAQPASSTDGSTLAEISYCVALMHAVISGTMANTPCASLPRASTTLLELVAALPAFWSRSFRERVVEATLGYRAAGAGAAMAGDAGGVSPLSAADLLNYVDSGALRAVLSGTTEEERQRVAEALARKAAVAARAEAARASPPLPPPPPALGSGAGQRQQGGSRRSSVSSDRSSGASSMSSDGSSVASDDSSDSGSSGGSSFAESDAPDRFDQNAAAARALLGSLSTLFPEEVDEAAAERKRIDDAAALAVGRRRTKRRERLLDAASSCGHSVGSRASGRSFDRASNDDQKSGLDIEDELVSAYGRKHHQQGGATSAGSGAAAVARPPSSSSSCGESHHASIKSGSSGSNGTAPPGSGGHGGAGGAFLLGGSGGRGLAGHVSSRPPCLLCNSLKARLRLLLRLCSLPAAVHRLTLARQVFVGCSLRPHAAAHTMPSHRVEGARGLRDRRRCGRRRSPSGN